MMSHYPKCASDFGEERIDEGNYEPDSCSNCNEVQKAACEK
jgi:hypothetical protein